MDAIANVHPFVKVPKLIKIVNHYLKEKWNE
jgi:hypothetical protein